MKILEELNGLYAKVSNQRQKRTAQQLTMLLHEIVNLKKEITGS